MHVDQDLQMNTSFAILLADKQDYLTSVFTEIKSFNIEFQLL